MRDLKLSIVVTYCNQKDYIKTSLDSIINQKLEFNYEILIGVDGIADVETKSILKEYSNQFSNIKVFYFKSPENLIGLSRASRNRYNLAKVSRGQYITFLDGDDFYINENRMQKGVEFLDRHFEYIGWSHSHQIYNDSTDKFGAIIAPRFNAGDINIEYLLDSNRYLFSNDCIFRNYFILDNFDYCDRDYLNDTSLVFWYLQFGNIYFEPIIMLAYRTSVNSIYSGRPWIEKRISEIIVLEEHIRLFNKRKKYFKVKIKKIIEQIIKEPEKFEKLPRNYSSHIEYRNLKISKVLLQYVNNRTLLNRTALRIAFMLL